MSCNLDFSESTIYADMREYAVQNNVPLFSVIEITLACNFSCLHCYNYDRSKAIPSYLKQGHLSKEEIFSAIEQLADAGSLAICLSGGEALIHPHVFEFIDKIKSHHTMARLKSNGALITKEVAKKLADHGVDALELTMYGGSPEVYEKFCGDPKGFEKTMQGAVNAQEAGVAVTMGISVHALNYREIEVMVQACLNHKIEYSFSLEITDRYDGSMGARDLQVNMEQFAELLQGPYGEAFQVNNENKFLQCSCANIVCGISAQGDVYPCIGSPIKSGNLREHSFADIWKNSRVLNEIRNLKKEDFKDCQDCSLVEKCNRSSGSAYINTGEYTGCDDFYIKTAQLRKKFSP